MISSRPKLASLFCCLLLLIIFLILSHTAWSRKSITYDEPVFVVGSFIQTHYFDFRCDPEDPPLFKYLPTIGMGNDALQIDRTSRELAKHASVRRAMDSVLEDDAF